MESAVEFEGRARVHLALTVRELDSAVAFYEALLGAPPMKKREHYAKFEVAEPSVNLALNEDPTYEPRHGSASHFGIQVKGTDAVDAWARRMREAGFATATEENVACCYAVQDKVWVEDGDGHRWEVYVVTEADVDQYARSAKPATEDTPCCEPSCCT